MPIEKWVTPSQIQTQKDDLITKYATKAVKANQPKQSTPAWGSPSIPAMPKQPTPTAASQTQPALQKQFLTSAPSAATQDPVTKAAASIVSGQGSTPIRSTLNNLGLNNNAIGYNEQSGYVTYNGQDILKPYSVTDGVSYANEADIFKAAQQILGMQNDKYVIANEYLAGKGLNIPYSYTDNGLTVGGVPIASATIGGRAYVKESDLNKIVNQYNNQTGLRSNADILNQFQRKYDPLYEKALNALTNRRFSYNPETDIVYQALQKQYAREGQKAMEDTVGSAAMMTGGLANSAAITAGGQARQQFSDQLMDRIPELYQAAYDRYVNEFDMNQSVLNSLMNLDNQQFNRAYGVNRDTISDIDKANSSLEERARYYNQRNYERGIYADETAYNRQQIERKNFLEAKANALSEAQALGAWTEEGAALWGVDPKSDPNAGQLKLQQQINAMELEQLEKQLQLERKYTPVRVLSGGSSSGVKLTDAQRKAQSQSDVLGRVYQIPAGANATYYPIQYIQQNRSALSTVAGNDYVNNLVINEAAKIANAEGTSLYNVLTKNGFGDLAWKYKENDGVPDWVKNL